MIVPPWVMFRWAYLFAFQGLVGEGGITWNNWTEIQNGSLVECMQIMIAQWFVLTGMTVWCNFVLPSAGNGSTAPWYFCLLPKYWKKLLSVCHTSQQSINVSVFNPASDDKLPVMLKQQGWYRPKDAEREHQRVITAPVDDDASPKIRVINLHKVFPSKGGAQPKVAVRCVSMGVGSGECFGLLGHNGAGKTTAINMLTGLYPPTSGTAYVGKYHIKDDINKIYADMGVCPQHDLLWPDLYAKEHLEFYGRLKGFSGEKLQRMVSLMLKKVNLTSFANRKAGGFSGGMKRRLSMANALMGGPGVVYMDEPSTGLDPASKHQLWDVIATAKQQGDRSMLLTTHSMEEADGTCFVAAVCIQFYAFSSLNLSHSLFFCLFLSILVLLFLCCCSCFVVLVLLFLPFHRSTSLTLCSFAFPFLFLCCCSCFVLLFLFCCSCSSLQSCAKGFALWRMGRFNALVIRMN